jgi:hypothetical protein
MAGVRPAGLVCIDDNGFIFAVAGCRTTQNMPANIKIQPIKTIAHVGHLLGYLDDAPHPRHEGVTIVKSKGINCVTKSEFMFSLREAAGRRAKRKKKSLNAASLHLLGGQHRDCC